MVRVSDGSGLPDWKIALQVDVVLRAKIDHLHDIAGQTEGQQPRTNHGADHSLKGNFLIHPSRIRVHQGQR